ncbi:MAG: response regulator [Nitrosomonadales bacterium]|nr:response regulator [Nitrosomonadales bacterium]
MKAGQAGEFVSTREAAARLGVALSTIQSWVETGVLPAWKTAGGHRRIPNDAVEKMRLKQTESLAGASAGIFRVLVVEDDAVQREIYRRQFANCKFPVQLLMAEDGFEGLMMIGRYVPDLLIADLAMPEMDGFKMIRHLTAHTASPRTAIVVVTALTADEIRAEGGLPDGIPVYSKPIPFAVLRSLVEHMASKLAA